MASGPAGTTPDREKRWPECSAIDDLVFEIDDWRDPPLVRLWPAAWPSGGGYHDIAQWLTIAGAYTGLNLDGGGSTTMACRDSNNNPILMNVPFGDETAGLPGTQPPVGNFFGVITQPLS